MRSTDILTETRSDENAALAIRQLAVLAQVDPSALLTRPDVAQTIRLATDLVVATNVERYEGLRGVMVGRAYSIAYQELGLYSETDGAFLGWLLQKVQAGLRTDFA
jgi:hypothetical protein